MEKPHWTWRYARIQWWKRIMRPMVRSPHPPEYQARASFWGLVVNFTPSIGFQLPMVAAIWAISRTLRKEWDFNFPLAFAWTWITNPATAAPLYYLFLVTGRFMLGEWDNPNMDFEAFRNLFGEVFREGGAETSWWQVMLDQMTQLWHHFGFPMVVGSLPWALFGGWVGYVWTLRFLKAYHARRARMSNQTSL
ncbi:MAG: DUF2062 domain-containing protein [Magnetococcales bacterium]|nr:DUF2062 domain-containing protein [Magnetococcales bacterium]